MSDNDNYDDAFDEPSDGAPTTSIRRKEKKDGKIRAKRDLSRRKIVETPPVKLDPVPDMSTMFKVDFSHLTDFMQKF